jgi:hypothetical protein
VPDQVRLVLLGVVVVSVMVLALVAWYYLRAKRIRDGRGDIRMMPFALIGGYGLPWPYGAAALLVGSAALLAFIHGQCGRLSVPAGAANLRSRRKDAIRRK